MLNDLQQSKIVLDSFKDTLQSEDGSKHEISDKVACESVSKQASLRNTSISALKCVLLMTIRRLPVLYLRGVTNLESDTCPNNILSKLCSVVSNHLQGNRSFLEFVITPPSEENEVSAAFIEELCFNVNQISQCTAFHLKTTGLGQSAIIANMVSAVCQEYGATAAKVDSDPSVYNRLCNVKHRVCTENQGWVFIIDGGDDLLGCSFDGEGGAEAALDIGSVGHLQQSLLYTLADGCFNRFDRIGIIIALTKATFHDTLEGKIKSRVPYLPTFVPMAMSCKEYIALTSVMENYMIFVAKQLDTAGINISGEIYPVVLEDIRRICSALKEAKDSIFLSQERARISNTIVLSRVTCTLVEIIGWDHSSGVHFEPANPMWRLFEAVCPQGGKKSPACYETPHFVHRGEEGSRSASGSGSSSGKRSRSELSRSGVSPKTPISRKTHFPSHRRRAASLAAGPENGHDQVPALVAQSVLSSSTTPHSQNLTIGPSNQTTPLKSPPRTPAHTPPLTPGRTPLRTPPLTPGRTPLRTPIRNKSYLREALSGFEDVAQSITQELRCRGLFWQCLALVDHCMLFAFLNLRDRSDVVLITGTHLISGAQPSRISKVTISPITFERAALERSLLFLLESDVLVVSKAQADLDAPIREQEEIAKLQSIAGSRSQTAPMLLLPLVFPYAQEYAKFMESNPLTKEWMPAWLARRDDVQLVNERGLF